MRREEHCKYELIEDFQPGDYTPIGSEINWPDRPMKTKGLIFTLWASKGLIHDDHLLGDYITKKVFGLLGSFVLAWGLEPQIQWDSTTFSRRTSPALSLVWSFDPDSLLPGTRCYPFSGVTLTFGPHEINF